MTTEQAAAIQTDAQERVNELKAVAKRLFPDRDDPQVLSELLSVMSQLRQAEGELT